MSEDALQDSHHTTPNLVAANEVETKCAEVVASPLLADTASSSSPPVAVDTADASTSPTEVCLSVAQPTLTANKAETAKSNTAAKDVVPKIGSAAAVTRRRSVTLTTVPPYHQQRPSSAIPPYPHTSEMYGAPSYPPPPPPPPAYADETTAAPYGFAAGPYAPYGTFFYPVAQDTFHEVPNELQPPLPVFPTSGASVHSSGYNPTDTYVYTNSDNNYYYYAASRNDEFDEGGGGNGVLDPETWSHVAGQGPVLDLPTDTAPPPSAAVSASHHQEATWKRRCLSVTCASLRDVDSSDCGGAARDSASPTGSDTKRVKVDHSGQKCTHDHFSADDDTPQWDAVVWRWLQHLGLAGEIDEMLHPGAQRVLVRWSSDGAVTQSNAKVEAAALHVSGQTVFENTLLRWN